MEAVYWLSESWNSWKLWWLPAAIFGSFRKLDLYPHLQDKGLSDLNRFLAVLDIIDWTQVSLLQSHCTGYEDICSPGRTSSQGDFVWF